MNAQEIITEGLRESNLIAIGRAPTEDEIAEALPRLNNVIKCLFGFEIGENLFDWTVPPPQRTAPVAANYPFAPGATDLPSDVWPYPPSNVRLVVSIDQATTVSLQQQPQDFARVAFVDIGMTADLIISGNGRLIEGAPTITIEPDTAPRQWLYRADLGTWIRLQTLTLTDDSPLPEEFDDLLITGLAIRLSARFGTDVRAGTVAVYDKLEAKLQARSRQITPTLGNACDIPRAPQSYAADFGSDL